MLGVVPDLICVLDAQTAEAITTEAIRYGQRVKVMVVSTPDTMRTPEALAVLGRARSGWRTTGAGVAGRAVAAGRPDGLDGLRATALMPSRRRRMVLGDRYLPVRSRCLHPGQQQGRRWPSSSSS